MTTQKPNPTQGCPNPLMGSSKVPILQLSYYNEFQSSDLCMRISHNSILTYSKKNNIHVKRKYGDTWRENFTNNHTKLNMSLRTKKNIQRALYVWGRSVQLYNSKHKHLKYKQKKVLNFITLTLPDPQKHSDKHIKRVLLNNLIKWLKTKHNMLNYLWVAEAQNNNNIHFHMVVDIFVPKTELQKKWNEYLQRESYDSINKFRFEKGQAPSTRIEKIREPGKIGVYMAKYLTKTEEKRKIYGRLAGMSDSIRNLRDTELSFGAKQKKQIWAAISKTAEEIIQEDFVTIFKYTRNFKKISKLPFIKEALYSIDRYNCNILNYELAEAIQKKIVCEHNKSYSVLYETTAFI